MNNKFTINHIKKILKELNEMFYKKQQRIFTTLTQYIIIGFVSSINHDNIWTIEDETIKQHNKKILLLKPKSIIHDKLLELEKKYNLTFERLDVETMIQIHKKLYLNFTSEDGIEIKFEANHITPISTTVDYNIPRITMTMPLVHINFISWNL